MNQPTITIAAPIRNREWILHHYLKALEKIDYPKNKIELFFMLNDSNDSSVDILRQFRKESKNKYKRIRVETYNRNIPEDNRDFKIRNNYVYTHLSILKNYVMTKVRTDKLLFIDSDILVQPDIINKLLKSDKDIISGLIWNGYIVNPDKPYSFPNIMKLDINDVYTHIVNNYVKRTKHLTQSHLMKVDLTGAVIMISKEVYKSVKYGFHPQGEDAYFCKMAQSKGFELFCDLSAFSHHIMNAEYLNNYLGENKQ